MVFRFHLGEGSVGGAGSFEVRRGRSRLARVACVLLHLPAETSGVPVCVSVVRDGEREIWTRIFGGRRYVSQHVRRGALSLERMGPLELHLRMLVGREWIRFKQERVLLCIWRLRFGLPAQFAPRVHVHAESEGEARFFVTVDVSAPLAGSLVSYWGSVEEA